MGADALAESVDELRVRSSALEVVLLRLVALTSADQMHKALAPVPLPDGEMELSARQHHEAVNDYLASRTKIVAALLARRG